MIILIGGLGNTINYFNCLKKTRLNPVIFYDFNEINDHESNIKNIIIENINPLNKLKIVAFSISCCTVVKILKALHKNNNITTLDYSLHLIDPQNIIETSYSPINSSYSQMKITNKSVNKNNDFGMMMVFSKSVFIKYLWLLLKQKIGLYYFQWTYYFHKNTPPEVDYKIINIGQQNVKKLIETYLFNYSPFDLLPCDNMIVHVYTGTESKYYNHSLLLSEKSCLFKIHKIKDVNHHILYDKNCRILDNLE